jgi:hypothetical protein
MSLSGESSGYQPSFARDSSNGGAAGGYQPTFGRRRPNFLLAGPVAKDPPVFADVVANAVQQTQSEKPFETPDKNIHGSDVRNVAAVEPVQDIPAGRAEPSYAAPNLAEPVSFSTPSAAPSGGFKFKFGAKKAVVSTDEVAAPISQAAEVPAPQSRPFAVLEVRCTACRHYALGRHADDERFAAPSLHRHRTVASRPASPPRGPSPAAARSPSASRARYRPRSQPPIGALSALQCRRFSVSSCSVCASERSSASRTASRRGFSALIDPQTGLGDPDKEPPPPTRNPASLSPYIAWWRRLLLRCA